MAFGKYKVIDVYFIKKKKKVYLLVTVQRLFVMLPLPVFTCSFMRE
jgi:hypothetical protein